MKKGENGSRENIAMLPWKFDVEFDDNNVLTCKLYSQLSFRCEEDNEFTAPPPSPVECFKYAPLIKFRKYSHFIHPQDIENLFSSCDSSIVERAKFTSESSTSVKNVIVPRKVVSFSGQVSSPIEYTRRRSKKERSTASTEEDSCVAKSYSEQSVFLESCIDDGTINERSNKGSRCNSSWDSLRDNRRGKNSSDDRWAAPPAANVSRDSWRRDRRKKETLEELLTDMTTDEGKRGDPNANSLYTIYKRSRENSRNGMLTEVDKIQLATTNSENGGKFVVETNLWKHALLANRSSDHFCPGKSSAQQQQPSHNDVPNYTRYTNEKYTFLRKGNASKAYKRTVRLRSTANLLDFNNRWIKGS
ncbi:uncharacterized protein LOC116186783 [Apis dorsata]|uniref:uncharacterized protein LOC116186783 n=1 Tax=Apis dorsata TaxID=7462 RepID=UPI0012932061|nr:uncharacterized protein LOC116186783 [Apis dorsata]